MTEASSSDALSGLAPFLRVRPEVQSLCRFGAQWASDHPPEPDGWAPFHITIGGTCALYLPSAGRSLQLESGDVALLPHGSSHVVHGSTTSPSAKGPFGIQSRSNGAIVVKSNTLTEPDAKLICGRLKFDQAKRNVVLSALPEVIVISAAKGRDTLNMRWLIDFMKEELEAARLGAAAITVDIASALLVMVVRSHLETERTSNSVLSLLSHPQAGRAVVAMLNEPGRNWSLDELASVANASRASFVRIFRKTAQVAPLGFLAQIRLELARRKLAASTHSLAEVAAEVGYQSESAFSRAFRQQFGIRPGEARMTH